MTRSIFIYLYIYKPYETLTVIAVGSMGESKKDAVNNVRSYLRHEWGAKVS